MQPAGSWAICTGGTISSSHAAEIWAPLDAPVTIATLLDSLLMFTIVLGPTPRTANVLSCSCELRVAPMKISIYAPYTKERFETARQHSILHPERIVGNPKVVGSHDHEISTGSRPRA